MCRTNPILTNDFNDLENSRGRSVPAPAEREAEAVRRLLPEAYEARTYVALDPALSELAAQNTAGEQPAP
jgi:hypothetical protein